MFLEWTADSVSTGRQSYSVELESGIARCGIGVMASKQIQEDLVEEIVHRYRGILKELANY
jgi:hypothetical protein